MHHRLAQLIVFSTSLLVVTFHTQTILGARRPPISQTQTLKIEYLNTAWNQDATSIETRSIVLRDTQTGKLIQVALQEESSNSSKFSGNYLVRLNHPSQQVIPEIYVPGDTTQDLSKKNLDELLQKKMLSRKPFVLTKAERGTQRLEIFDSKESAKRSLEAQKKLHQAGSQKNSVNVAGSAIATLLTAEELAKLNAERKKLADMAFKRESDRARLEQEELTRQRDLIRRQQELNEAKRAEQKALAAKLAQQALGHYMSGQYKEAESLFAKSTELDPENLNYYYQYGISLYRNGQFNKSIVILRLAKGASFDHLERDFYVALNEFQLKEFDHAFKNFDQIRLTRHKTLGPSSAFYMGLIDFQLTKYEQAKEYFQEVLDTSVDPQLDNQAEENMEKIDRILQLAALKSKKFFISLSGGAQYDSNILLVADSTASQASASDIADPRMIGGGSIYWRPIFEREYEFGLKGRVDTMYTLRTQFAQADPLLYNLNAPFVYNGELFKKPYRGEIKPGYEILNIDSTNSGTKKPYMNSVLLDLNNTLVMNTNWISSYNFRYRGDVFPDSSSQNATKIALNFNNIYFIEQKKGRGLMGDLNLVNNAATGNAYKFFRYDVGVTYMTPTPLKAMNLAAGLTYFNATYPDDTPARADSNTTASLTLTRPLLDWLSLAVLGSYTLNSSNVSSKSYSKYVVGTILTADFKF